MTALTAFLFSSGLRSCKNPAPEKRSRGYHGVPLVACLSAPNFPSEHVLLGCGLWITAQRFFGEFSFKIRDLLLKQFSKYYSKLNLFTEENLRHKEGKQFVQSHWARR